MGRRHLVNDICAAGFHHIVCIANAPVRVGRSKGCKVLNTVLNHWDAGTLPRRQPRKKVVWSVKEGLHTGERKGTRLHTITQSFASHLGVMVVIFMMQ